MFCIYKQKAFNFLILTSIHIRRKIVLNFEYFILLLQLYNFSTKTRLFLTLYCIWTIGVCLSPAVAAVALTTNQFWQQQQSYCRESIFGKQQFFLRLGCLITPTAVQFLPCSFIILYHTARVVGYQNMVWISSRVSKGTWRAWFVAYAKSRWLWVGGGGGLG